MQSSVAPTVFLLIVALCIGMPIAAVFLRAAISICNRLLGVKRASRLSDAMASTISTLDESNPFAVPKTVSFTEDSSNVIPIPEPSFGSACAIILVAGVIHFVIGFLVGTLGVLGKSDRMTILIANQFVACVVSSLTYKSMLPTTLGRAVAIYVTLILLAIVLFGLIGFAVLLVRMSN